MMVPERSDERDAALEALVATIPFPGWTLAALCDAAGANADLLFPLGPVDMVESWSDLTDRRMPPAVGDRVPDRVRDAIIHRLQAVGPEREAVRRGLSVLATHPSAAARVTARTVDALWHAAGDRSADWSWYSKRAILSAVYGATLLFWLRDDSEEDAATIAFLDRRLAGVGRLGRWRASSVASLQRLRPGPAA